MKVKQATRHEAEMEIYRSDILLESLRDAKTSHAAEDALIIYFAKKRIIMNREDAQYVTKLWFPEYYRNRNFVNNSRKSPQ